MTTEELMADLDRQFGYWNTAGAQKSFQHPLNLERVSQWLFPESRILDFGCGYGRSLGELFAAGYRNLIGLDFSLAMIGAARAQFPEITFEAVESSTIPLPDESLDGALLFTVLTCVPTDDGQLAIVAELHRLLRPGGSQASIVTSRSYALEQLVSSGLTPSQAIHAGTGAAARILGAHKDLGTIEMGKWADFIILDADPLVDIRNTRKIWQVMQYGQLVDRPAILVVVRLEQACSMLHHART